eukprot:gene44224-54972_t
MSRQAAPEQSTQRIPFSIRRSSARGRPSLSDEALIRAGAGNYNSMCIGCHLAPSVAGTELSKSLYPAPPNLSKLGVDGNPAAAFWIIKH